MVGYLCVQSLPVWAWMFVSVLERQRAILKTGIITQLADKGTVESWLFGLVGPAWFWWCGQTGSGSLERVQTFILVEGLKIVGGGRGLALSGTESSLVQTFCESCVHLDITYLAIHMTRGLVIQGCPTLNKLLTCLSVIWLLLLKVLHILHARTIPT